MKSKSRNYSILIILLVAFVGVLSLEKLTRPIPLTYAEAVKEVKEVNDNLEITFNERVSDYELNYYNGSDANADIEELSEVVIIAWSSTLNKYLKNSNTKNEMFDLEDIDKILYSEVDNEGKNIVVYGANVNVGGSSILPRLAMNYYFALAIFFAIISVIGFCLFKKRKHIKLFASITFYFSIAYIVSSVIILGFNQIKYFMIRDLSYTILSSVLLFGVFYNLLIKRKVG